MKNGKKPTREQRKLIMASSLDPREWLVVKAMPGEMLIVCKKSGCTRVLKE